jgi:hypothetical protein
VEGKLRFNYGPTFRGRGSRRTMSLAVCHGSMYAADSFGGAIWQAPLGSSKKWFPTQLVAERHIPQRKRGLRPPTNPLPVRQLLAGGLPSAEVWRPSGYWNLLEGTFRCRALVLAEWVPELGGYVRALGFT